MVKLHWIYTGCPLNKTPFLNSNSGEQVPGILASILLKPPLPTKLGAANLSETRKRFLLTKMKWSGWRHGLLKPVVVAVSDCNQNVSFIVFYT